MLKLFKSMELQRLRFVIVATLTALFFTLYPYASVAQKDSDGNIFQQLIARGEKQAKNIDVTIELVGLDSMSSHEVISYHNLPNFRANFPDFVFRVTNNSNIDASMSPLICSLMNFSFPESISAVAHFPRKRLTVKNVTGSASMEAVGEYSARISPGQTKYISYKVGSIETPSFEARRRGTSSCTFHVGDENLVYERLVPISSEGKFFSAQ